MYIKVSVHISIITTIESLHGYIRTKKKLKLILWPKPSLGIPKRGSLCTTSTILKKVR